MGDELQGVRVAFLVANEGVEQRELTEPWQAVRAAGAETELLAPEGSDVQCFEQFDRADVHPLIGSWLGHGPNRHDVLVIPGGVANSDHLRTDPHAVRFAVLESLRREQAVLATTPAMVRRILADAGVLGGRRPTSWPSCKTDLPNAWAWNGSTKRSVWTARSSAAADQTTWTCSAEKVVRMFAASTESAEAPR